MYMTAQRVSTEWRDYYSTEVYVLEAEAPEESSVRVNLVGNVVAI